MAKNSEVYKTAQERAEAFGNYCEGRSHMTDNKCLLETDCNSCRFAWLDIEADEEKKPDTIEDIAAELREEPLAEDGAKPWLHYLADRILAAHNRVAKAAKESEAK